MSDIANKFLKPNQDGEYYAQQSQVLYGLWTPYGIISPLYISIWPDGSVDIAYHIKQGVKLAKAQTHKLNYVKKHGVKVYVTYADEESGNA